jgi:hypothetical protein
VRNSGTVEGGGLWLYQSDAMLDRDIVSANTSHSGGGLYVWDSSPNLTNVVIIDNRGAVNEALGSGLYVQDSSLDLVHTTIARNSGGDGSGLHLADEYGVASSAHLTNTVVSGHSRGIVVAQASSATLRGTLWFANTMDRDGAGTIQHSLDYFGDPAFTADGYHLTPRSAAKDNGVDAGVTTDIDGQMRPEDGGFDLGADEVGTFPTHVPLVLRRR